MNTRPKRKATKSTEISVKVRRKWSDKEIKILLTCVKKYGYKNLNKIQEHLPGRSVENIKCFIRTAYDKATRMSPKNGIIDAWINLCETPKGTTWADCVQVAQVLKYLSVDGLLENHPLPAVCKGIDFGMAYRLLYQAVMGYPIQPVNKATADFVLKTFMELRTEALQQTNAIKNVELFLHNKSKKNQAESADNTEMSSGTFGGKNKKGLRVYERKRSNLAGDVKPSVTIKVQEANAILEEGPSKNFSVVLEGSVYSESKTVTVPVPPEKKVNRDEEELLNSLSYNPFQIPRNWLEEPLYVNVMQNFEI